MDINEDNVENTVKKLKRLGGLHSAKIILYSVEFDDIENVSQTANGKGALIFLAELLKSHQ